MFYFDKKLSKQLPRKMGHGPKECHPTIGEIQENTSPADWFVVAGKLNIADWLTRGKEITELDEHSDWHKGPSFMKGPF